MEKRTRIKVVTVDISSGHKTFTVDVPANAKKVTGIIVTAKLSANNMPTNRHYFGKGTVPGLPDNTFIQTLSNEIMVTTLKVFSANAGVGESFCYARPARFDGHPTFESDGISISFNDPVVVSVTDPLTGFIEDYNLYTSVETNLGQSTIAALGI